MLYDFDDISDSDFNGWITRPGNGTITISEGIGEDNVYGNSGKSLKLDYTMTTGTPPAIRVEKVKNNDTNIVTFIADRRASYTFTFFKTDATQNFTVEDFTASLIPN